VHGDRVRWGPILAGLVCTLAALALLGTLGSAIGASAYDAGDSARNFGIGAGIWGIVSVLIAFAFGGWVAARSITFRERNDGLLNGAMVWAVAIPLMAYLLASMVSPAASAARDVANAAADRVQRPDARGDVVNDQARAASAKLGDDARPVDSERVASGVARSAWSTLAGLILSLGAASIGGYVGGRSADTLDRREPVTPDAR
jgi:hypothetical protein